MLAACRAGEPPVPPSNDVTIAPGALETAAPSDPSVPARGPLTGWLRVVGPRIMTPDGTPFHGRGANLNDTRSCDSCSWEKPHVEEVTRRIDEIGRAHV